MLVSSLGSFVQGCETILQERWEWKRQGEDGERGGEGEIGGGERGERVGGKEEMRKCVNRTKCNILCLLKLFPCQPNT